MTSRHPPVEDWATDFDHTDPVWVADPYPIWAELRQRCPVAHSDRYGGTWLPVTHELVSEVAYDAEHFTSRSVVVSERRPGPEDLPAPIGLSPPITSDPPFHGIARKMLLPAFGPRPMAVRGTMILLMIAGIDTTWSAIGASLWHLARHPGDRRRLADDPGLMGTAVEEFLRAYAPVTMARLVAEDFDFHGHQLKEGDWLLLPFPSANRDRAVFTNPDVVQIDRATNRHAAFGLGRHRCLGSSLARMELRVALEEWLTRYPDFELADSSAVTWSGGQVRGPRTLPVTILG